MSDPNRAARAKMTAERWARLEPLVDAALDLAPDRRAAFYQRAMSSHPELRADLERLVRWAEDDGALFTAAAAERFALLFDDESARQRPTDLLPQFQASLGTAYALERELGGGGMSRVFLARESKLGRRVVIKVLPPELAAGINAERFDREIKLAASLQQANIVPLLAAEHAAGFAYYTMPFVEGRSLRDRLAREGLLPIADAVNVLRDVARALAFAHAQGVVHRDIKPGNVLLSGGTAVVTDFGIAKALTAARGDDRLDAISHGGPAIGTPPYMAPEQAAGDPGVDHRADIYAFGCLAYEVFTGRPPFHGQPPHVIIAAHSRDEPRPITERRGDVPPAIAALISQCLQKNPARRPQSASDLLDALDAVPSQPASSVRRWSTAAMIRSAAAVTAVVVGAGAYAAYRGASADHTSPVSPLTLGAIPFRNLAREPALEYRADGISDEILRAMGKVPGIRIVGRNAGRRYKDRDIDEQAVQRELGAALLMTGTYQERAGRIIVTVQINDSITRAEVWSANFESAPTDFRRLPDSIAHSVAGELHTRYARRIGEWKAHAVSGVTTSPDAYEEFVDGQFFLRRRFEIKESVTRFEAAIRLDSSFARAHGALAMALTFYPWFYGTWQPELRDSILHTARRALALGSTVADAQSAIALVYANTGAWDSAATHFRDAIALDRDNFDTRFNFGRISTMRGDLREAITQFEQAATIERTSPLLLAWSSYAHFLNGETELARAQSVRAFRLDSTLTAVTNLGALVDVATGLREEARRLAARQPPDSHDDRALCARQAARYGDGAAPRGRGPIGQPAAVGDGCAKSERDAGDR